MKFEVKFYYRTNLAGSLKTRADPPPYFYINSSIRSACVVISSIQNTDRLLHLALIIAIKGADVS